jgi:hypothetical protein
MSASSSSAVGMIMAFVRTVFDNKLGYNEWKQMSASSSRDFAEIQTNYLWQMTETHYCQA